MHVPTMHVSHSLAYLLTLQVSKLDIKAGSKLRLTNTNGQLEDVLVDSFL